MPEILAEVQESIDITATAEAAFLPPMMDLIYPANPDGQVTALTVISSSTGKWYNNNSYRTNWYYVKTGAKSVILTSGANGAVVAFVKDTTHTNGTVPDRKSVV